MDAFVGITEWKTYFCNGISFHLMFCKILFSLMFCDLFYQKIKFNRRHTLRKNSLIRPVLIGFEVFITQKTITSKQSQRFVSSVGRAFHRYRKGHDFF